jgi:pyruvate kinase
MLSGESAMGAYPVESVAMLARIAAAVEPTRRHVSVQEMYAGIDLTGRVRPQHLVAVSIEASLGYLRPAALFVPSASGATARRLAALHLPVQMIAISSRAKTCQDLWFSYAVFMECLCERLGAAPATAGRLCRPDPTLSRRRSGGRPQDGNHQFVKSPITGNAQHHVSSVSVPHY